jgi:FG-GAP-like repeat/FG-GAP repeat
MRHLLSCSLFAVAGMASAADNLVLHTFTKQRLSDQFFCEGSAIGDFNKDGVKDVAAGPYWYAGPELTAKHTIYPPKAIDPNTYSDNFLTFARDMNGDGLDDVVVVGWPGKEGVWFENPGNDMPWPRHVVMDIVDNESAMFADVTGDGKPEMVCNRGGFLGYYAADWSDAKKAWTWKSVSAKGKWHKYTHGIGQGDVNGDGRVDLLLREGWWEQPASLAGDPVWKFHAQDFSDGTDKGGGAQMLVDDVDGDGRNDVITSIRAHEWGLAWFQQQADGSFKRNLIIGPKPEDSPYGVAFSQLHALAMIDIDGDGLKDIITGKRWWAHGPKGDPNPGDPAVLYWFRREKSAAGVLFVPHLVDDDSGVGCQVTVGDVTGDGKPDIVVGNKKGTAVFRSKATPVDEAAWKAAQPKKK